MLLFVPLYGDVLESRSGQMLFQFIRPQKPSGLRVLLKILLRSPISRALFFHLQSYCPFSTCEITKNGDFSFRNDGILL